jgi:L-ectoine synthase
MKVIQIENLYHTSREVKFKEGTSLRPILEKDGMGFSVHKTTIPKGQKGHWHYKNHLEACYCIEGEGELTDLKTGNKWFICPDTIYLLDEHDDHEFEAFEDIVLISIFNPPCKGNETHREDGSYE